MVTMATTLSSAPDGARQAEPQWQQRHQQQQQRAMVLESLQRAWGVSLSGWKLPANCSNAYGIKCDSEGYITDMNLYESGLTGSVPMQILMLSRLTLLNLDSNRLSGPLILGIASSGNRTGSYHPSIVTQLELQLGLNSLQYLSVYNNSFSGPLPADLSNLTQLTAVYLNKNSFSGSISSQLGSLKALSLLYLDRNNLTGSVPAELGKLDKLRNLHLDENQLTGALPSTFAHLTSLTELSFDSTIMCPDKGSPCPGLPPPSSWGAFCESTCKSFCTTCPTNAIQPENPDNGSNTSNSTSTSSPSSSDSSGINGSSSSTSSSSGNNGSSSSTNSSSGSTGVIIGVVVVVVVVVVAAIVGFIIWQRKWCCGKQREDL